MGVSSNEPAAAAAAAAAARLAAAAKCTRCLPLPPRDFYPAVQSFALPQWQ